VDWADARVHVGTHGLHYGSGIFEGIRAYETPKGTAVFRLTEHLKRLHNSAKILYMELPYSIEQLRDTCHELIGINGLPECYLRPIAFYGFSELGGNPGRDHPVAVVVMSCAWGSSLGAAGPGGRVISFPDERRYAVPVVLVCPKFTAAQAREWIEHGEVPELAKSKTISYLDIDSGHWPMISAPADLARLLAQAAEES